MIKAICIDDENRPNEIPISKWLVHGNEYHITKIFDMKFQDGTMGCEVAELDISQYAPYNCFKVTRFVFRHQDSNALFALIKACSELNNVGEIDIQDMVNNIPIKNN